ncbi:MAG: 30S ribosomal protein S20 [Actinomycetota bacterium]
MANIKSQIKRNRQNEIRHERNKSTRSALRTSIKRFLENAGGETAEAQYREAARALDKAAAKGVIHKNQAANRKSRLARRLKSS